MSLGGGDAHLGKQLAGLVLGAQGGAGVVVIGHDVQADGDPRRCAVLTSTLWCSVAWGSFCRAPRADQGRLGFTVFDHGHGPAVIVLVFDDLGRPAVTAPQTGFLCFWGVNRSKRLRFAMIFGL